MRRNQKKALKLLNQANRLQDHVRHGKATKRYEQALALDSTNTKILKRFSIHMLKVENYVQMVELCNTIIQIEPSFFAYHWSGKTYFMLEDYENALERLNSAINLQPDTEESECVYLETDFGNLKIVGILD